MGCSGFYEDFVVFVQDILKEYQAVLESGRGHLP